MKRILSLIIALHFLLSSSAQTGFYREEGGRMALLRGNLELPFRVSLSSSIQSDNGMRLPLFEQTITTTPDWDTSEFTFLRTRFTWHYMAPIGVSMLLIGAGFTFCYEPHVNEWAVAIRDKVENGNLPKLYVDDYLQYLPAITPVTLSLCGLKGRHKTSRMVMLESVSYILGHGWLNAAKYGFSVRRPDSSVQNSFPSGHTCFAFTGAEVLRREYGEEYPWIAVAGYVVASAVGLLRVYHNRHWAGDVLAGAGLGILSTSIVYWLLD